MGSEQITPVNNIFSHYVQQQNMPVMKRVNYWPVSLISIRFLI